MSKIKHTLLQIPNVNTLKTTRYQSTKEKTISLVRKHTNDSDEDDDYWNDNSTYGEEW